MFANRSTISLLIFSVVLCGFSGTVEAARSRRGNSAAAAAAAKKRREAAIKAAQEQYAAGQRVLSIAEAGGANAQSRLTAVISQMQTSVTELKEAESQIADLSKNLAELEKDILKELPSDSPYVITNTKLQSKRAEMAKLEAQLLHSAEYVTKRADAMRESPAEAAQLRKDTLESNVEYSMLRLQAEMLATELVKIKRELFAADPEWKETHASILEARGEASDASSDVYRDSPKRADPLRDIKDAKQAAAAARAVMADAMAVLQMYKAPTTPAVAKTSKAK